MAKNQPNAKQHPEAELLAIEKYSHSSPTLSSKTITQLYKFRIIQLIIMKMKMKTEKVIHRCDINRPSSRHGNKYSKYKRCDHVIIAA